MKLAKLTIGALICMMFPGCGELLLEDDPEDTPEKNFQLLWQDFDRTYPFFIHKNIDWDSLYSFHYPLVSEDLLPPGFDLTGGTENHGLFITLRGLLARLRDAHVNLYTTVGEYSHRTRPSDYPDYFDIVLIKSRYLSFFSTSKDNIITQGILRQDIGYIHIASFESGFDTAKKIDHILQGFEDAIGLVIDIRNNSGGSERLAKAIAGRFADRKRLFRYYQYRNGPEHSDFTDLFEDYVEPDGPIRFSRPVTVLTNRKCFSSAESFVLAMKAFPHVAVIGDSTGGSSGHPIYRELPNGWTYTIPRLLVQTSEKKIFEGIGIPPDSLVRGNVSNYLRDSILQAGIDWITGQQ